jgi:DNA polymerase III alpha subunit
MRETEINAAGVCGTLVEEPVESAIRESPLCPSGELGLPVDLAILNDLEALQRDPATAELIRTGRTMGCFYIESPSMRSLFQRMHCECYEDVVAASSIIRPGVAESGMMKAYVERFRATRNCGLRMADCTVDDAPREGNNRTSCQLIPQLQSKIQNRKSKIETGYQPAPHPQSEIRNPKSEIYIHPKLAEVLSETFGVMVYQEDVLKVVHEMAGMSLGEADVLRRAMSGKAGAREAMESLTERFFAGCRERGVPEPVIGELWRQIETFARFSFCKGHSAAFAVLSYQVAYLKAHHPAEFMAAVLANGGGYYGAAAYVQECRRMGLRVLGPDVNESAVDYRGETQEDFGLRIADCGLKSVGGSEKGQHTKSPRQETGQDANPRPIANPKSEIRNPKSEIGFVRVGFAAIKNFPLDLARRIVRIRQERPFDSFEDFLRRVRPGPEATEKLIRVGAFDRFDIPRERLFLELDIYFHERGGGEGEQLMGV